MKRKFEIRDNIAFIILMLIFMIVLLFGVYLESKAQTVLLPTWVADSLIYEAKLSRQCTQVVTAQQKEIESLGKELIATGTALKLSQSENKTMNNLLTNSKESKEILTKQFALDIKKEKRKTRKWKGIAVLEALGVIGLVLLL